MELPRLRKTGSCQVRGPTCLLETECYCPGYWKRLRGYERIEVLCYFPICLNCYPEHFRQHEKEIEEAIGRKIPVVMEQVQTRSEIAV